MAKELGICTSRYRWVAMLLTALLVGGCTSVGPRSLVKDRIEYLNAVGDSWAREALLNIVKIRYHDWPVFMEVQQVVAAYTMEHTAVAGPTIKRPWAFEPTNDTFGGAYTFKHSERPTFILEPLGGAAFVRATVTPVSPSVVFALVLSGWPAEPIYSALVQGINGKQNVIVDHRSYREEDPAFVRFVRLIQDLQMVDALAIRVWESSPQQFETELRFMLEDLEPSLRQQLDGVRKELSLSLETDTYRVAWARRAIDSETISIQTRSVMHLLTTLSWYVDVPADHIDAGIVEAIDTGSESLPDGLTPLMYVHSGRELPHPSELFAWIEYQDRYFWVDLADVSSRGTFAYLGVLLSFTQTGEGGGAQLVITTEGGRDDTADESTAGPATQ